MRHIFAVCYPFGQSETTVDFLSNETKISAVNSGRLSFVFIAKQNQYKVFLKIVKPGFVRANIPFSVLCTEACRLHSHIPTFRTYRGKNGELHQYVPEAIDGVFDLGFFAWQTVTLSEAAQKEIDTVPETLGDIPGGVKGQLALLETLGQYVVEVSRALTIVTVNLPEEVETIDPAGFNAGRQVACGVFKIDEAQTFLKGKQEVEKLQKHINELLPNIGDTPEGIAFKEGLESGDLTFILNRFNQIEQQINDSLDRHPSPNIINHNEVKPANIGAIYDSTSNHWSITQSFDFDNIGFGTPENGDRTPLEKDLGRTLSFFAFDKTTGEFYPDYAKATIKGFLNKLSRKLYKPEIERLKYYIQLGVVTSYLWRSSYFADELLGRQKGIQLDRLDPSIHILQIKAFDQWLELNDFHEMVSGSV